VRFTGKEFVLALMALLLANSVAIAGIDDFKLDSVEIVDLRSRTEIDWLGKEQRPAKALIMATFSADVDLREYARRYGLHLFFNASVCQEGLLDQSKQIAGFGVYDDFGEIDASSTSPDRSPTLDNSSTHLYHAYFGVMFKRPPGFVIRGPDPAFLYDLQAHPEDVCVQFGGGVMWFGLKFISNTIVIPKEDIAEAIAQSSFWQKQR
jgi:hypothetical protein